MKLRYVAAATWVATFVAGCAEPRAEILPYSRHTFESVSRETAFDAAQATMNEYFRVDEADSARGIIRSCPVYENPAAQGLVGRSLSSSVSEMRVAELRVQQEGNGIQAECLVRVYRNSAAQQQPFVAQATADDTPAQTPIQETQGFEPDGRENWSSAGFDHKLERQMLASLAERLGVSR